MAKTITFYTQDGKRVDIVGDDRPKLLRALEVFGKGFKVQMFEEGTMAASAATGLYQGLKYKGDIRRGLVAALVVDAAISSFNGIRCVIQNWEVL